ncbi:PIN/TRAM domain-containing protein [Deinococcus sonorensis]|uniref:PIN/TRAM domain-containing protein n=2 Tax=Deinococcus sonorensis TaxID=309891 RepID=A0AAU7UAT5_9DEIO
MPLVRISTLLLGLLIGWLAGRWLAAVQGSEAHTAQVNTLSLMMGGALLALLLADRAERLALSFRTNFGRWYSRLSPSSVTAATFALAIALLLSVLISNLLGGVPYYRWWWNVLITLALAGFFVPFALRNSEIFGSLAGNRVRRRSGGKLLDSNVIIDGRLVDLVRSGLLEGDLVVPGFVLRELQLLSDHGDPQRRARGKRGLGVLEELYEVAQLRVDDWDVKELNLTDDKLVRMARETGAKIISNDAGLSKVAKLHGVSIINLNEAAVALRPQLQVGDTLQVTITKGGQQAGQGVGYLEDGTMMVVEDGAKYRNRSVRVVVLNNVQTSVGRMVFAKADPETNN